MSGEIRRFTAQADTPPSTRAHGSPARSAAGRRLRASLREQAVDGLLDKARVAAATEAAMDVMDGVKAVDAHRRSLAGDDQVLNRLLFDVEVDYVNRVTRVLRGRAY
ncbi:hypothetical protein AB0I60_32190 [Actinosynnema sp. NPDC050436]|uniref:hypothetical protein n=1 Tax=Actinosynnema sp. NPDC050436 TaxID=3155659 RepID=UPI00340D53C6